MQKILRNEKIKIYCRHCKKKIENVWVVEIESILGTRYAFFCADCQKLIGTYSSKDFIELMQISNHFFDEKQTQLN